MTSIHQYKNAMVGGGSRPNQFRITLTFPSWVAGGEFAGEKAQFTVGAASLPEQTLGVASLPFRGRDIKWAGDRTFGPWSVNVYNDTEFAVRNALESWSQGIVENESNRGRTNALQYQTQSLVEQLDRNDQVLKTYVFYDLWPIQVGEIGLDWGNNDQIEIFPVTFDFLTFEASDVDGRVGDSGPILG